MGRKIKTSQCSIILPTTGMALYTLQWATSALCASEIEAESHCIVISILYRLCSLLLGPVRASVEFRNNFAR